MPDPRRETGLAAEKASVEYLETLGFHILERNYRKRYGEIDIIARKGNCIHFIEIKSRRSPSEFEPMESWGEEQRQRFILLAEGYLAEHAGSVEGDRIDVSLDFMGVEFGGCGDVISVELVEDAFRPE